MLLNPHTTAERAQWLALPLSNGGVTIVDASDFGKVSGYSWHAVRRQHTTYVRAWIPESRRHEYLHRFLTGFPEVDHRDGNGLNNRRQNLRSATPKGNAQNQRKRISSSTFKGVSRSFRNGKVRWLAQIRDASGKKINLGRHSTELQAACAYDAAAKEFHQDFANVNFP